MIQTAQQGGAQGFAIVGRPLIDDQPATRIQSLLAVFQEAPGQMTDTRTDIGIKVDENQVGRLSGVQQFQRIANADVQARIVIQPQIFNSQARYVRA
ncbi:hypothetical protein D3C75_644050 [compost metagenome]